MRSAALADDRVTLGAFRVRGSYYAIDVSQLREVVRWQEPICLPRAPGLVEGVIDLRGAMVPVVDLARVLGLGQVSSGKTARYAIVEVDGRVVGLAVDRAEGVLSVAPSAVEDAPAMTTHAGGAAVSAMVRQPDSKPVLLLSLEHVLERIHRSLTDSGEEAA